MRAALTSCWQGLKHSIPTSPGLVLPLLVQMPPARQTHSSGGTVCFPTIFSWVCWNHRRGNCLSSERGAALPCPSTWCWVFTLRVERVSCNSCARHLAQSGPDVHDRQSRRVCSAKGSRCHKPLGGEDGLGLPIRYHQGWVCRADGDRAAVVSSHSPVVRIRCKESICSVCQYDLISYSMFSREALSP